MHLVDYLVEQRCHLTKVFSREYWVEHLALPLVLGT